MVIGEGTISGLKVDVNIDHVNNNELQDNSDLLEDNLHPM